jgi:hypothetical protein
VLAVVPVCLFERQRGQCSAGGGFDAPNRGTHCDRGKLRPTTAFADPPTDQTGGSWGIAPPAQGKQVQEIGECASRGHAAGQGWVCVEGGDVGFGAPDGSDPPPTASPGDTAPSPIATTTYEYRWRFTNQRVYYGIGETTIGMVHWSGNVNFNGRQGQVDQNSYADPDFGPPVRYDFRATARYKNGDLYDAFSYVAPAPPAFTKSYTAMRTWFPYYRGHAFTQRFGIHLRAEGITNPGVPSGAFISPTKISPVFYCGTGHCRIPVK